MKIPKMFNDEIKNYRGGNRVIARLTGSEGRSIKYDTQTGKIVQNSKILTFSKYLFLLCLFLFWDI